MKCPVCGAAELIHDTRDLPYTYKGESTFITAVTGDFARPAPSRSWMPGSRIASCVKCEPSPSK